ncbi:MAG: TrmH family RNA methyltransferase [Caldicoprobacterales bacterium]|jgi:TrmH family RNA methyltransferase
MQGRDGNKERERPELITGSSNNTIKYVRSLQNKKYRDLHLRFIAEGQKMVEEALKSDFALDMLIFSEAWSDHPLAVQALESGIRCIIVKEKLFKSLSDTQSPQGVLAVAGQREYDFQKALKQNPGFLVILDGIKDPGNLGTIIRTIDAAGGDGVVLINDCVDPYNPKAVRATMGSVFRVPIYREGRSSELLEKTAEAGFHIAASDLCGEDVFAWKGGCDRIALIIGSESHGISREVKSYAHSLVKIPMKGGAESLNASVAAGILIYEIFRKGRKMDG